MKNLTCLPILILTACIFNSCGNDDDGIYTPYHQPPVKPEISFTYSGNNTFAPAAVSFQNATSNASSYRWSFGDGYTSTEGNSVHVYEAGGTYMVKLVATGQAGSDSATKSVTVLNAHTKLKITDIALTDFSFLKSTGTYWDVSSGPDVYFKITNSDTLVFYDGVSQIDSNVAPVDLPLAWNLASPFTITDFTKYKAIKIYDGDFPVADEYMGKAGFTPSNYATAQVHYPDTIHINEADVFITLSLKWE